MSSVIEVVMHKSACAHEWTAQRSSVAPQEHFALRYTSAHVPAGQKPTQAHANGQEPSVSRQGTSKW